MNMIPPYPSFGLMTMSGLHMLLHGCIPGVGSQCHCTEPRRVVLLLGDVGQHRPEYRVVPVREPALGKRRLAPVEDVPNGLLSRKTDGAGRGVDKTQGHVYLQAISGFESGFWKGEALAESGATTSARLHFNFIGLFSMLVRMFPIEAKNFPGIQVLKKL